MLHQPIQRNSQTGNEIDLPSIMTVLYNLRQNTIYKKRALLNKTDHTLLCIG